MSCTVVPTRLKDPATEEPMPPMEPLKKGIGKIIDDLNWSVIFQSLTSSAVSLAVFAP